MGLLGEEICLNYTNLVFSCYRNSYVYVLQSNVLKNKKNISNPGIYSNALDDFIDVILLNSNDVQNF